MFKRSIVILSMLFLGIIASASERPSKKLIHFGWMVPRTLDQFRVPVEKLEKDAPFDGIGTRPILELKRDGKKMEYNSSNNKSSSPVILQKSDFDEWIEVFFQAEIYETQT